ncbi:ParB/RepB/Spo0J family partition protein [Pseudorhodobacter sp. E13]|uniref:ParB/RepB/Spo0J family partition protein n=1 Tax=Pseudorhodobacter sp. E13 TaxID=2487931 RepID=UPI0013157DEC|nr:ParB/RepB/Spo0J family partition protein [Pseudorhodobacter sp. E13]
MLTTLPIAEIDATALPRDRIHLNPETIAELQASIATNGLRMPIEVFQTETGYALISGLCRLTAVTNLCNLRGTTPEIAAFIRSPATLTDALIAMVEENDIRQNPSAWERGLIITTLRDNGEFETLDAATRALYPHANAAKRQRLRSAALVVEELDGHLATPEHLSERQILRLSAALRADFTPLIVATLQETRAKTIEAQWQALLPVMAEAEQPQPTHPQRPGRPRRVLRPAPGVVVRREMTSDGWVLRFTGPDATGMRMDFVMDEVERLFG